jgi:hypothetical protein
MSPPRHARVLGFFWDAVLEQVIPAELIDRRPHHLLLDCRTELLGQFARDATRVLPPITRFPNRCGHPVQTNCLVSSEIIDQRLFLEFAHD